MVESAEQNVRFWLRAVKTGRSMAMANVSEEAASARLAAAWDELDAAVAHCTDHTAPVMQRST